MKKEKRMLKPYHGIITLVGFLIVLFVINPLIQIKWNLGLFGTLVGELLFLVVAVGSVAAFRGDFRKVFPIHKPKWSAVFGTLVLWLGTVVATMVITLTLTYFFPQQVLGTSESLGNAFTSVPLLIAAFIVSVVPAICEEAVFRGVLLNSLWPLKNKWLVISIVGVVFGICHGSIWRFFPTAILGIAMGYLVVETNNILYSSLFHFVNNLIPVIMLFGLQAISGSAASASAAATTRLPLASVGIYVIFAASVPFLIYIGNYLIHKGRQGAPTQIFPREKRNVLYFLIAISVIVFVCGVILMIASIFVDATLFQEIINNSGYRG